MDKNLSTLGNGHVNAGYNEADKPEDDSWYVDMMTASGTAAGGADPDADPFKDMVQSAASLQSQPQGIPTRSASEKQPEGRCVERGQIPKIAASAQKAVARSNTSPSDPMPSRQMPKARQPSQRQPLPPLPAELPAQATSAAELEMYEDMASQNAGNVSVESKGAVCKKQPEGRHEDRGQIPNITASAPSKEAVDPFDTYEAYEADKSHKTKQHPVPAQLPPSSNIARNSSNSTKRLPPNMPSISRGERTQSMKPTQQAPQLPKRNRGQSTRQGTQACEETIRSKTMGTQRQQGQFRMSQMGNNMDMKKRQEEIQQKKERAAMVQQGPRPPSDRRTDQSRPLPTPNRAGYEDVKVRPARKKSSLKQTESQQQTTGGLRPVGIQVSTHGGDYYSAAQLKPVSLQAPVETVDYYTTSGGGLRPVGPQAPSAVEGYYTIKRGT